MTAKPLCIYHHGCADGFAAAWAVRFFYGDGKVDFHPGIYGEAPPDVTGRDVILVDFSYKHPVLMAMLGTAKSLLILDHHQSAEADLFDLPPPAQVHFDMQRCGARMAWDFFFPGVWAPLLFDYIQDRDLWQFKLPNTREVTAALYSYPFDFAVWDGLMTAGIPGLISEGSALTRKQAADVAAIVRAAVRPMQIGRWTVPAANVPWMLASDVGHALCQGQPFAATYYDDKDGRRFSLRSAADGLDVAKIAETFGGGGHRHAAGFRLTREQALDLEMMAVWA